MALLELNDITLQYEAKQITTRALDGVSLKVEPGEFVTVAGSSGSGKSSLLSVLGLLQRPTSGRYLFEGVRVDRLGESSRARMRRGAISFIFQDFQLIDYLSVVENVELAPRYAGVTKDAARKQALDCIERVRLSHRRDHLPPELSGGQRQRVAVARALAVQPRLLLADEPTGNLDAESGSTVLDELRALNAQGTTIIVVTHAPALTESYSRRLDIETGKLQP